MRMTMMMYLDQSILPSNIQKYLGKGWGWIIDSVIDHTVSLLKYNPYLIVVISNCQKN